MSEGGARVVVTPLGGLGRFGRNALLLEIADGDADGDAIVVDFGVRFLHADEAPGFDLALPDLARLERAAKRLVAYVVTHGHEDHVGALPYAFDVAPARLVTLPFTADVVARRFARAGRARPEIEAVEPGVEIALGDFVVRFVPVSHSIPDSAALVIDTPVGRVVHSGDFRIDTSPLAGPPTDLAALSALGPVRALFSDSTGALSHGATAGEASVVGPLTEAMADAPGLVVVGVYGSHFQRVKAVALACRALSRRLVLLGPSVRDTVAAARARGLVDFDDVLAPLSAIDALERAHLVVVAPGCQGERGSTLDRVAHGEHPRLVVEHGDRVILSARTIPGNELAVARVTDAFASRGVVVLSGEDGRHVSGHGARDELIDLVVRTDPALFVALHGGERHLEGHRALAAALVGEERVVALTDGEALALARGGHERVSSAPMSSPFVQGHDVVRDPTPIVVARERMMQNGVVVVRRRPPHVVARGVAPALVDQDATRSLLALVESHDDLDDDALTALVIAALKKRARARGQRTPEVVVV